jgi:DUF177 domain-containing protein
MLNDTLPSQIDVRKLVVQGAQINATVPVSSLPRFGDLLFDESGSVEVKLQFYFDDERIRRVDGRALAKVRVACERCLEPMSIVIDTQFELGVVWSEDDSKRLPSDLEPLIVGEELINLSDVVSVELILSFPYISYHDEQDCPQSVGYVCKDPDHDLDDSEAVGERGSSTRDSSTRNSSTRENPFKVLEQLKSGKKS